MRDLIKLISLFENVDEIPTGDYPLPDGFGENFINYVEEYHVGDYQIAFGDYDHWLSLLEDRHAKGGDIYRVVFVKKGEDAHMPFGRHWSMEPLTEEAHWRLWSDVCYRSMSPYEDNGYEMIEIHARTAPRNVTIDGVNLPEEYKEAEINLLNENAIEVVKMTRRPIPRY